MRGTVRTLDVQDAIVAAAAAAPSLQTAFWSYSTVHVGESCRPGREIHEI